MRMRGQRRLILDTILLGIVGAAGARIFTFLLHLADHLLLGRIAGYQAPGLASEGGVLQQFVASHGLWFIPLVTTLGGLISGLLVYSMAPEAEGHGTDTAVKAFHRAGGFIRARVTPIKILASAVTIGSGGAAGREGPTALFSAGIGSIYATVGKRSDSERRLLVLVGMAAGLSAIFRSPIGTAIFAIEVLYRDMEFEASALLYTLLGSVVAYAINGIFVGFLPLFAVAEGISVQHVIDYGWYALLGLCAGLIGAVLPNVFYLTRDLFRRFPVPPHVKPAIGGLAVGLLAMALPQVLGGGYGWIQEAMNGQLAIGLLLLLIFGKMAAFALTVSSGGSGGVFAPSLFVGAMLGGFLSHVFHQPPAAFVIVGMAAVFGSAARVPIATLLMVAEMTGGYHLMVPAALAVLLAHVVQVRLTRPLRYQSLYEAQAAGRLDSPAHRLEHLKSALTLLGDRGSFDPGTIGHLNLMALLESRVPLDLPDGGRLLLFSVREDGILAGKPAGREIERRGSRGWEIVAIFRGHHMLLPHAETILEPGDQVLVLAAREESAELVGRSRR